MITHNNNLDDYIPSFEEEIIIKYWLRGDTRDKSLKHLKKVKELYQTFGTNLEKN
jgi:hypothetical protein